MVCVLTYGGKKGLEFHSGSEPETTFNPVVHNLTEFGDLNADEINFGMGFVILDKYKRPISIESIDKRYIQFEAINTRWIFSPKGVDHATIGSGKIVKCSEMKNSKLFELTNNKRMDFFKPYCLDFKGLKFNSYLTYGGFNENVSPATLDLTL
jgi:hypothetical protein